MAYTTYRVPATIFEDMGLLNKNPLKVFLTLGRHYDTEAKISYPKSEDIANLTDIQEGHVRRAWGELEKNCFILSDQFNNIKSYPVEKHFYSSRAKFYILPDFLIMDIENALNKNKIDKEAVLMLKRCMGAFEERTKSVRKRTKSVRGRTENDKSAYQPGNISVPKHYMTLLNYYNELLQNRLSVVENFDKSNNQTIYHISIKDSFNTYTGNREGTKQEKTNRLPKQTTPRFDSHISLPSGLFDPTFEEFKKDFNRTKDYFLEMGYTESQIQDAYAKVPK